MSRTRSLRAAGAAAGAAALALALAGCASTSPSAGTGTGQGAAASGAGPADSYLATGSGWVDYLQWDATGSGTLTQDTLTGTAPHEQVSSSQSPITVTVDGSSVDISGLSSARYGSLSGGSLTLQALQTGGTLGTDTFMAAGQSAFNAAVQALRQRAQSDDNAGSQQQQAASRASANQAAEQRSSTDLAAVQGISFGSDLGQLSQDVRKTNSDLAAENTAAAAGPDGPGGPQCYNLTANVDYDAESNVEHDARDSVGYDLQNSLRPDLATGRQDISALQADLSSLQSLGLAPPPGAPSAIAAARSAIVRAVSVANGDIQQVNSDVSQAYSLANSMATGNCAGDGPGAAPSPVKDLS